ncbi:hypothetical protein Tco_0636096 [Tanacetum coccineum]
MLDRKELTLTLGDFRTIFHLPQATDNNHDHFIPAPKFSKMVPFYINNLGFTLKLRSTSNFKTTGLLQPRQTLCKMFSRCLTTRVTGKSKGVVGMKIPNLMITDEIKLTENYRTTRAPKKPNPKPAKGELSAPRRSTVIRLRIPPRRSTRLTPPTPIPTTDEADDLVLQDTLQVSLAEQKSREELKARQNMEKVKEHLMAEEIEKLVEESENVEENVKLASSPLRNDDNQTNLGTRLEPRSDKKSLEVEKIADISQPVNVIKEEKESAEDDYELRRKEKGKHVEEIRNTPSPTTIRYPRILTNLVSSDTEKLQELTEIDTIPSSSTPSSSLSKLFATNRLLSLFKSMSGRFKRYKSFFDELQGKYGYQFGQLTTRIYIDLGSLCIEGNSAWTTIVFIIPLLYRGEYSQWCERFMNYLEEQTDGEAMINSIQNGDHPLLVVTQVSLTGTTSNVPPPLKDKSMWTAEEKKNRKIDHLARSLLIQGLPNNIYSLIDSNNSAKEL